MWVSNLRVTTTLQSGPSTITYNETVFACRPAAPACRPANVSLAIPATALIVSSGWQLLAALSEVARQSPTTCLPVYSYTVQLANDVSLSPLQNLLPTYYNPVMPLMITANLTIEPVPSLHTAVLDLAEVRLTHTHTHTHRDATTHQPSPHRHMNTHAWQHTLQGSSQGS